MANYKREQINPFKNKWEDTGKAVMSPEEAEVLNDISHFTKIRYVLDEEKPKRTPKSK